MLSRCYKDPNEAQSQEVEMETKDSHTYNHVQIQHK